MQKLGWLIQMSLLEGREPSLMVIGLTPEDGAGPVELFDKNHAYHLMGESETREGELMLGARVDGIREAVGSANDEHQPARCLPNSGQPTGQLSAAQLASVLVEEHNGVGRLYFVENQRTLSHLLLLLREAFRVFKLGDDGYFKRHVMAEALLIVADDGRDVRVGGLAHKDEKGLHGSEG